MFPFDPNKSLSLRYNRYIDRPTDSFEASGYPTFDRRQVNERLSHARKLGLGHELDHVLDLGSGLPLNRVKTIIVESIIERLLQAACEQPDILAIIVLHIEAFD